MLRAQMRYSWLCQLSARRWRGLRTRSRSRRHPDPPFLLSRRRFCPLMHVAHFPIPPYPSPPSTCSILFYLQYIHNANQHPQGARRDTAEGRGENAQPARWRAERGCRIRRPLRILRPQTVPEGAGSSPRPRSAPWATRRWLRRLPMPPLRSWRITPLPPSPPSPSPLSRAGSTPSQSPASLATREYCCGCPRHAARLLWLCSAMPAWRAEASGKGVRFLCTSLGRGGGAWRRTRVSRGPRGREDSA
ncbi:uncharacterized protein SCHCODRAFT_02019325 [Schizophyllum commune H4-8]|uniref:uncharacterized protein n=1 Tax=Schizophyllum commune (strain H4-8 / FGSC 9210) TaxID=578458 RepID=UPI0021602C65|nr:uncharacterized protein SCHCODRAFT_02019325 [Schizophyllum commune H4-8]KAI5899753.1 hypothetical protein SCHCODRAFT_02019325 [Schizophyllum commune H4-8]